MIECNNKLQDIKGHSSDFCIQILCRNCDGDHVQLTVVGAGSTYSLLLSSMYRFSRLSISHPRNLHTSASAKALGVLAQPKAEQISAKWKGTSATGGSTKNFIGGEFVESKAAEWIDVHDPVSSPTLTVDFTIVIILI